MPSEHFTRKVSGSLFLISISREASLNTQIETIFIRIIVIVRLGAYIIHSEWHLTFSEHLLESGRNRLTQKSKVEENRLEVEMKINGVFTH